MEFEQLQNARLDEILYDLLDVVAVKIDEVSQQKVPATYTRNFFKNNEQYVYNQIKNGPHVFVNTRSGFGEKLMSLIEEIM